MEGINLNKTRDTEEVLFYQVPDGHTAKFGFTVVTMTAVTVPLKYRFISNRDALDTSEQKLVQKYLLKVRNLERL